MFIDQPYGGLKKICALQFAIISEKSEFERKHLLTNQKVQFQKYISIRCFPIDLLFLFIIVK